MRAVARAAVADRTPARFRAKHHGRFRRVVSESGRKLQHPVRILQPESETGTGYPDRRRTTGSSRAGRTTASRRIFCPRRQWGVFTVTVPKDFGSDKLTWTLTANGVTTAVPGSLNPLWELSPFHDANGNTPPFIGFAEAGPFVQGPRGQSTSLHDGVAESSHSGALGGRRRQRRSRRDAPEDPRRSRISWSKFRGPGSVTFANDTPAVETADFRGATRDRVPGQSGHHRYVQRAGRIRAARGSQRLVRRRRPRIPVLLVERSGQSLCQPGS